MKTRCPECQTTFRVTPEQLKARAGKVRCGQCQTVFNALDSLIEETIISAVEPVPPSPKQEHRDPAPEVQHETLVEAISPAIEPATTHAEPAVPAPTSPAPVPPPAIDAALSVLLEPSDPKEQAPQPSAPPAPSPKERAEPRDAATACSAPPPEQAAAAEPPSDALSEAEAQELGKATGLILPREMTEVPGYSKWSAGVMAAPFHHHEVENPTRWPYVLVAILLAVALVGQLTFRFRGELAIRLPSLRPALESFSTALGSHIPLSRRVELVSIESSDLQSDAARGNLLVLSATVRNRAGFAQAYPALELALTDTQDTPIARRVFLPEEYLPAALRSDPAFAAHTDIAVRLWIEAKDISAAGYRLYVFYP